MGRAAEVVVVGAGIIGASIGYELARHEAGTVVVLDKARSPGEGSTGASSSISRCRYTHSEVIRLALHGQRAYAGWSRFTGLERPRSGLNRVGVMWMMGESIEKTQRDVERLRSEGVDAEWLNPEELRDLFPVFSDCGEPFDLTGEVEHVCEPGEAFLYEPGGGYSDPVGANQDLIDAALGRGVSIEFDSPVVDLMKEGDRVAGVRLADGSAISAGLVINAAGPWCNALNEQAGFDHRWTLNPTRIQTIYRSWPDSLGALPVGADASTGIYFRPELGTRQVLVGSVRAEDEVEIVDDPDSFKRVPDPGFSEIVLAALHHRIPSLEARGDVTGIAGLYTINREDVHPIVGPSGVDGFWVANGFSGHGFKLAPGIGSMIAQALTGRSMEFDTDVEMGFFAVDRDPIELDVKSVLA